ncbi:MAG: ribosomal protein L31E [Candidatus Bathyarchaeota archaeon B23]|nr:MAG: ribosomal protein L31E [Candidatus Bathyarchaeota archaeon B23]
MSESVEERIYMVPLKKAWAAPRWRRAERAVRVLREFVERHMKPTSIVIDPEVNEAIWRRGIQKPPRRIRVRVDEEGAVRVTLAEG